jgi:5'-deoxynucleotidase YfbR-like HD superfamily hydrolase
MTNFQHLKLLHSIVVKLKNSPRQGWLDQNLDADSIAEHTCGAAIIGWFISQLEDANHHHVTEMLLVHDLVMSKMEDVTPQSGKYQAKNHLEQLAKHQIAKELPPKIARRYQNLFDEFQAQKTKESQIAREADKLETLLQAIYYQETTNQTDLMVIFLNNYKPIFKTKTGKEIFNQIANSTNY